MISMQPLTRWFGAAALVVSSLALWRAESRATTAPAQFPTVSATAALAASSATVPNTPVRVDSPAAAASPEPATTRVTIPVAGAARGLLPTRARPAIEAGSLRVRRLVVTREIENREPVAAGESFSLAGNGRIGAFLEIENDSGEQVPVFVRFERPGGGAFVGNVELAIPAQQHWRTWGFTRMIRTPGSWVAVITTATGRELARAAFEVTA